MRLTTKGRYGMRLLIDIAQHERYGPVSMSETALRQDISVKYLERLVGELQRAGLVRSQRGREGGHLLAVPPEKITVGDVVRILEGESSQLACSNNRLACPRSVHCLTRSIWIAADQAMFEKLDAVTVRDILEDGQSCLAKKELELARAKSPPPPPPSPDEQAQRRKLVRRIFRQRLSQVAEKPERPAGAPKKILVVDDDPVIVEYIAGILAERGYATCSACDGGEAMEVLLREGPDLITLDLEMPGEWGPKFHQSYTKLPAFADIPVVVVSGLPGIHRAIRKAVATVSKPFDPAEIIKAVEDAIGAP